MDCKREPFGFKTLLLCSAAVLTIAIPAGAQERMPAQSQDRPAASQSQSPAASEPSTQQDRSQRVQDRSEPRGTTGQGSNPRSNTEAPADAGEPRKARDRDAQSPDESKSQQQQRSQSNEKERRGNQQSRDNDRGRDGERDRDNQQTQSRDNDRTQQRNQSATPDRQRNQDNAQSPRNRDGEKANRENARTGDGNRQAAQPTEQQRTRISTSIRQTNVEPVRNVNFSVSVGTAVPASVRVHPVTPAIVEVYPQYRGYSFVVVEDEVVIIEPSTKKIVTVIDQGKGGRSASVSRSKVTLTDKQRSVIRRSATERRTTGSASAVTTMEREYVVGDELPDTIEIESFPDTVYTEVPEVRSYRYVVHDDDVYLVDPTERRVIEVIR